MIRPFSRGGAPLALLLACALAALVGCSGGAGKASGGEEEALTGSTADIVAEVAKGVDKLIPEGSRMGATSEREITADDAQHMLGISAEDFGKYVEEASVSTGMLTTQAHEVALVKCKDAASAAEVKKLIAEGFNTGKWICVLPEKALVVDSGSYVLLAVSKEALADAAAKSFSEAAGDKVGDIVVFYDGE